MVGDSVWPFTPAIEPNQCKKLTKHNNSPYILVENLSYVNYKIALENNISKVQIIHNDRLSPD